MSLPALIADRFVVERPAGAGGMGTIYRAVDCWSGAPVALKLPLGDGDQSRARALAEADALAALDHPAVVRLVAHGAMADGRPFIAMEWLEGEDLAARLQRARLTAREAVLLGARAAGALDATVSATTLALPSAELDPLERLRALVAPLGGRAHRLLDGSLVASWLSADPSPADSRGQAAPRARSGGAPRDQAARAARAALLARRRFPGAALALASGLTEQRGALPLGPALDRAAALLGRAGGEAGSGAVLLDDVTGQAGGEAGSGAVLLDDVTAGLLDARFEVRASAAGLELVAARALHEEEARLLLGRPAPCVGRERELRVLGDLLDECVAEPVARAVLVTAPAGVGKSRLRHELLRLARLRGDVDVWSAAADELGAGSPFALLGDALQRAAGAHPGAPLDERQARLEQRVARRVPEAERARVTAFLGEIIAAPFPAARHPLLAAARRSPTAMAEQIRAAWLDLLAAEVAARPVLLVLEDLHWGDGPSLQLVDASLAALHDRPLMVLALARPEVRDRFPDLWAGRDVQELRLGGLTRRAASELVRHALPDAGGALVQRLVDRADGNAFYLEEMIRAVASGRGDALPETITAMVQARLEALAPDERRLLRAASVFGEVFCKGNTIVRRRKISRDSRGLPGGPARAAWGAAWGGCPGGLPGGAARGGLPGGGAPGGARALPRAAARSIFLHVLHIPNISPIVGEYGSKPRVAILEHESGMVADLVPSG